MGETGDVLGVSTFYFLPNESFSVSQQVCLCLGTMFCLSPTLSAGKKRKTKALIKGYMPFYFVLHWKYWP